MFFIDPKLGSISGPKNTFIILVLKVDWVLVLKIHEIKNTGNK